MVSFYDIVIFIYGVIGFAIGWLWGRHRSMGASFIASILIGAAGFAVGKSLEWAEILTQSWIDNLAKGYKWLGASADLVSTVFWFAIVVILPILAIAAFRKSDRQAVAELESPRGHQRYH